MALTIKYLRNCYQFMNVVDGLQVEPFASIANMVCEDVPRVLINKTPVRSFVVSDSERDVLILGKRFIQNNLI